MLGRPRPEQGRTAACGATSSTCRRAFSCRSCWPGELAGHQGSGSKIHPPPALRPFHLEDLCRGVAGRRCGVAFLRQLTSGDSHFAEVGGPKITCLLAYWFLMICLMVDRNHLFSFPGGPHYMRQMASNAKLQYPVAYVVAYAHFVSIPQKKQGSTCNFAFQLTVDPSRLVSHWNPAVERGEITVSSHKHLTSSTITLGLWLAKVRHSSSRSILCFSRHCNATCTQRGGSRARWSERRCSSQMHSRSGLQSRDASNPGLKQMVI